MTTLPANNSNEAINLGLTQKDIKRVAMFCNKSSVNKRWNYYSKIYLQSGQTKIVKEVWAITMQELASKTQSEMAKLPKG